MKRWAAAASAVVTILFVKPVHAIDWSRLAPSRPTYANDDAACKTQPADPYEPGARALSGMDAGKCLPQDIYRPSIPLYSYEAEELGLPNQTGRVNVANVYDPKGFLAANIPLEDVVETRILVEHYLLPGPVRIDPGHVMLRVFFGSDVILRPQVGDGPARTTRELVFSVHTSHRFTADANLTKRVTDGSFSLVPVVFTHEGKFAGLASNRDNSIEQYRARMSPEVTSEYLSRFIQRSNRYMLSRKYHLIDANCSTELFSILDSFLQYTPAQQSAMTAAQEGTYYPTLSPTAFEARGLVDAKTDKLPNLENE